MKSQRKKNTSQSLTIREYYDSVAYKSQHEFSYALEQLGLFEPKTKSMDSINTNVISIIESTPENVIASTINNSDVLNKMIEYEKLSDDLVIEFINNYSIEAYRWIQKNLSIYLSNGGHNMAELSKLAINIRPEINQALITACVYADNLADSQFWASESKTTRVVVEPGQGNGNEILCRHKYWAKLQMLCIDSSVASALGIAGLTMPGVDVLDAAAIVLGATEASWEYHNCVKYGY